MRPLIHFSQSQDCDGGPIRPSDAGSFALHHNCACDCTRGLQFPQQPLHCQGETSSTRLTLPLTLINKAGDFVCAEHLSVGNGQTLDILCDPPQQTDTVTVELPGTDRCLAVAELQVYGSSSEPVNGSGACYSGSGMGRGTGAGTRGYFRLAATNMALGEDYASYACASCNGPGPSQCTKCDSSVAAFVPVRNSGSEGYCQSFLADGTMSFYGTPSLVAPTHLLIPSHRSKWGLTSMNGVAAPETAHDTRVMGATENIITCYVTKSVTSVCPLWGFDLNPGCLGNALPAHVPAPVIVPASI